MKRALHLLLAACMIFTLCAGCGGEQKVEDIDVVPTIFADITGIPQDKVVMTIGESEITSELYFYWLCYICSSWEYNLVCSVLVFGKCDLPSKARRD